MSNKTIFRKNYNDFSKCQNIHSIKAFILHEVKQIESLEPKKKIIILLDSLNQLTPSDFKNVDKWFFTELPNNLKLVVSTIPGHGNLLNMMEKLLVKKRFENVTQLKSIDSIAENFLEKNRSESNNPLKSFKNITKKLNQNEIINSFLLEIKEFDASQSEMILKIWLNAVNRNLSELQWADLRKLFNKGKIIELFLKLIYDVVVQCRSYEKFDEEFLKCTKADEIIMFMFKNLEKIHGSIIFRRAVCYMSMTKNGLSNSEIEDILSLGGK